MALSARLAGWLGRNVWLLLRIGIGLALTLLVFQASVASLESRAGAVIVTAAWILLIYSIVSQGLVSRAVQRGSMDSKETMSGLLLAYSIETAVLLILLAIAIAVRVFLPYVVFGIWVLVDIVTMFWLWRKYKREPPGRRAAGLVTQSTFAKGIITFVAGVVIGIAVIGWLIGITTLKAIMLMGGAVVLVWLLAKLIMAYFYTRV